MQRKWRRAWNRTIMAALVVATSALPCNAMPQNGHVSAGNGTISETNRTMTINQASDKLAVNWNSFGIAGNERVHFIQPSTSAVALNRVIGGDPSAIYGQLTANGQIFLVNPNGILFAPGSQVDVGGIVASALQISDNDFMNGKYSFTQGSGLGEVINQGLITASGGGYVALLAPEVRNDGVIVAQQGTVLLGAGSQATLNYSGDGKINLAVDQNALHAYVANKGIIQADGGNVVISARTAGNLINTVVNNEGVIQARSARNVNGVIVLDGGTSGVVSNNGTLDATGHKAAETGGTIKVLGDKVALTSGGILDVTGDSGGGRVMVGGDFYGAGLEQNASAVYIGKNVSIKANALQYGDGGKVSVWADDATRFYGAVSAKGGNLGGDGGKVETSGKRYLDMRGLVDVGAAQGQGGQWLLDPGNITIQAAGSDSNVGSVPDFSSSADNAVLTTASLTAALNNGGNVTITTGAGSQAGDITVNDNIVKTGASESVLTLNAHRDIVFNGTDGSVAPVFLSSGGKLNLVLNPDSGHNGVGATRLMKEISTNGGSLTFNGDTVLTSDYGITLDTINATAVGGISFSGKIDSANSLLINGPLTIKTGNGNVVFSGAIGANRALGGLTVETAGNVTTNGTVNITGSMNIGSTSRISNFTNNAAMTAGEITVNAAGIRINGPSASSTGNIVLNSSGEVSNSYASTIMAKGDLTVQASGDITLGSFVSSSIGSVSMTGNKLTLAAYSNPNSYIAAYGDITLSAPVSLSGGYGKWPDDIISSTGGRGNITFNGQINLANQSGLRVDAGGGNIVFNKPVTGTSGDFVLYADNAASLTFNDNVDLHGNIYFVTDALNLAEGKYIHRGWTNSSNPGNNKMEIRPYKNDNSVWALAGDVLSRISGWRNGGDRDYSGLRFGDASKPRQILITGPSIFSNGYVSFVTGNGGSVAFTDTLTLKGYGGSARGLEFLNPLAGSYSVPLPILTATQGRPITTESNVNIVLANNAVLYTDFSEADGAAVTFNGNVMGTSGGAAEPLNIYAGTGSVTLAGVTGNADPTALGNISIEAASIALNGPIITPGYLSLKSSGAVSQTQPITALGLEILGLGGRYTLTNSGNNVSILAGDTGSISFNNSGTLSIGQVKSTTGLTATGNVTLQTHNADMILNESVRTASAGGVAVLAAGHNFINNYGIDALQVGVGGRWLVYSTNPLQDTKGGLTEARHLYNRTYLNNPPLSVPPGNAFLYSYQPSITVTASGSGVYGNTPVVYTNYGATFNGDELSDVLNGTPVYLGINAASHRGNHVLTLASGSLTSPLGYAINFAGSYIVNQRPITITANDRSKIYGNAMDLESTQFSLSEVLPNSDSISNVLLTSEGAAATAHRGATGTYAITASNAAFGNGESNDYAISYANGTLTVNKRAITVAANDRSKTYGNELVLGTVAFSLTEVLSNSDRIDGVTLVSEGAAAMAHRGATGTYVITASNALFGSGESNDYAISYGNGTLAVDKRPITITASDRSKIYGSVLDLGTSQFSLSEILPNSDSISNVSLTSEGAVATAHRGATGTYAITASNAVFGSGHSNDYTVSYSKGTLTVDKRPITVTTNNRSKTYGDELALGTTEFKLSESLPNNDSISHVTLLSKGSGTAAHRNEGDLGVGLFGIHANYAQFNHGEINDYQISYRSGTLTVLPAPLTYVADAKSKYAGAPNPVLTGNVIGFVLGETLETATNGTLTFTTNALTNSSVGVYAITGSGLTAKYKDYNFLQAPGNVVAMTVGDATKRKEVVSDANKHLEGKQEKNKRIAQGNTFGQDGSRSNIAKITILTGNSNPEANQRPADVDTNTSLMLTGVDGVSSNYLLSSNEGAFIVQGAGNSSSENRNSHTKNISVFTLDNAVQRVNGAYNVSSDGTKLTLVSIQHTPEPTIDEAKEYKLAYTTVRLSNDVAAMYSVGFDGVSLKVYPLDENAIEFIRGTESSGNKPIIALSLLTAIDDIGISIEQINAVYIYTH